MRVVVYQEKKIVKERVRVCQTNLSTPMNIYNMYIFPIQIHMRKLQLKKKNIKQNKNVGCKRDFMERPLVNIYKF